jgi:hypothetical protein
LLAQRTAPASALLLALLLVSCTEARGDGNAADAGVAQPVRGGEGGGGGGGDGDGRSRGSRGDRWRSPGVYVDGEPIAILSFGELPIALEPVWLTDQVSGEKKPGEEAPAHREAKFRAYRFTELLKALKVKLPKVRELHVYGPKPTDSIVVTGAELRRRGRDFLFRFSGEVEGKPIPIVPPRFGNGRSPDRINAVLIYVDKKPPRLVRNEGFELDGRIITDIPYHGEPLSGGVRVYLNDRLVMVIKRRNLEGGPRFSLVSQLESHGIDTQRIAEAWAIHRDRRVQRFTPAQLEALSFRMVEGAQGQLLLGDEDLPATAIALHEAALDPELLPKVLSEEEF